MGEVVYVCHKCMRPAAAYSHVEGDVRLGYLDRCLACASKDALADAEANGWDLTKVYHHSCPKVFMRTDLSKLSPKTTSVANWEPNKDKTGLLLHGPTGTGKSRMAWWIVNRMWTDHVLGRVKRDKPFGIVTHTMRSLGDAITSSYGDNGMGHDALMKGLVGCGLLMLDDLGKERMTPRVAADLFAIIDERASHERPTIITTNFNGQGLAARFDDAEMGAAVVRRLRDFYHVVSCS